MEQNYSPWPKFTFLCNDFCFVWHISAERVRWVPLLSSSFTVSLRWNTVQTTREVQSPPTLSPPILIFDIYSIAVSNPSLHLYIFNSKEKSHIYLSETSLLEAPVNSCSEQLVWESVESASHPVPSAWCLTRLNSFKCRNWNTYRWRWVFWNVCLLILQFAHPFISYVKKIRGLR